MSEGLKPDFGDYVRIEQNRFGVENEHYVHKVIGRLRSNNWVDVPVVSVAKETVHEEVVEVVACITCGVSEREVLRYRLEDCKPLPNAAMAQPEPEFGPVNLNGLEPDVLPEPEPEPGSAEAALEALTHMAEDYPVTPETINQAQQMEDHLATIRRHLQAGQWREVGAETPPPRIPLEARVPYMETEQARLMGDPTHWRRMPPEVKQ